MDIGVVGVIREERVVDLDHLTIFRFQLLFQESRQIDLPYETNPLRVFLVGGRQVRDMGYLPDLWLCQVSDREESLPELLLGKLAQEIALVLVRICSFEYSAIVSEKESSHLRMTE